MSDVLIKVNNISKSYSQGDIEIKVLSNFSLTINRGDFFAITGPSGSGKTTLLNILGLIDNFESGNILYFNNDISNFNEVKKDNLRLHHLGFVYQSNNLFDDFNITENVALPLLLQGYSKEEAYENSKEMLNTFGLPMCSQRDTTHKAITSLNNEVISGEVTKSPSFPNGIFLK